LDLPWLSLTGFDRFNRIPHILFPDFPILGVIQRNLPQLPQSTRLFWFVLRLGVSGALRLKPIPTRFNAKAPRPKGAKGTQTLRRIERVGPTLGPSATEPDWLGLFTAKKRPELCGMIMEINDLQRTGST
jgi:hypothetical protein